MEQTPHAIAKGTPLNVDECTVASFQTFLGEDLEYDNRRRMQQQQLKQWCEQSMNERAIHKHMEERLEQEFTQKLLYEDELNVLKAHTAEQIHRDLLKSIQQENKERHLEKIMDKGNKKI